VSAPFYVSPEQQMKDRADYARKGIARGRSVVVVEYADGIVLVAENPSQLLHKISEIYDRIAFAAAGRYNEYENLRIAGVRLADLRGYSYDRRDVTARGLANAYAQTLGGIFSSGGEKPYEVELFVAEVGDVSQEDQIYRLAYDGSVSDVRDFGVMGGATEAATEHLRERWSTGLGLENAVRLAVDALAAEGAPAEGAGNGAGGTGRGPRTIAADQVEAAVLDRTRPQPRKFRRLTDDGVARALAGSSADVSERGDADPTATGSAGPDNSGSAAAPPA
jgi:proteasome alpha subunit